MTRAISSCSKQLLLMLLGVVAFTFSFAQNPIVTENALTGNPKTEWDITGAGSSTLQGFATDISVNRGTRVNFKINTTTVFTYTVQIYRLGYYQGNGARLITTLPTVTGTIQPSPLSNATTGLVDCGNWSISAFWDVPSTAVSGVYIAKLTRVGSPTINSHIVFIVRDDASTSPLFFQTSDATWQAYNNYGGNSLYNGATSFPGGHAAKVSYNRPFNTRAGGGGGGAMEDWLFNAEYPMIRFLERNGYNVSYTTCIDADRRGNLIPNHKVYLSVGHDEYWSAGQRANVEAARNAGTHMAFFSGNEVYWKTRWENSTDASNTAYRTLVCYKEGTQGENVCGGKCDPTTAWTGLWRAGCDVTGGGACSPENALTGQISWGEASTAITVPAAYKSLRFWRNTSVASLATGQTATLANGTLGYEYDLEQFPGSYPSGRITLSSTTIGSNVHKLSLYRHASGALVFGAGTIQWSWGLDNVHDRGSDPTSVAMQQATVNLFADMGVQPGTLMSGLVAATASTDLTAPVPVFTAPAHNATVQTGTVVNITGTATDAGGQLVGIEVSVDNGVTWQIATGTTSWSYSWTPSVAGTAVIKVRGFDDSGNMSVPGAAGSTTNRTITVTGSTQTSSTIFQPANGPVTGVFNDGLAVQVGMKFRSSQAGYITGVRYFKGAGSTGIRTGNLWSSAGVKLAEIAFSNETASGWQQAMFTTPYQIAANTTYIIGCHSASGDYVDTNPFFTTATTNGTLTALASGTDGPNGLYIYSTTSAFPTDNYQTSNYWVDVVYTPTLAPDVTAPTVTSVVPANLATGISAGTTVVANFSEAINPATVTTTTVQLRNPSNVLITATVTTNGSQITLTPSAPLANLTKYTATITGGSSGVKDLAGNALAATYTWSFTTATADVTAPTVQSVSPLNAATGVVTTTAVSATFNESVNASTVTTTTFQLRNPSNVVIAATVSTTGGQITLTPTAALANSTTYTVTITGGSSGVKDLAGNALASNYTWSFTTAAAPPAPSSIFPTTATYTGPVYNEGTSVTLGMKFRTTQAGYITGVRFFKGTGATGTKTGTLWSNTGTKLAEAVFINETASGWQQVLFATPYQILANTTYIISYHTTSGLYGATNPYFTSAVVNGPLRALADGEDGPNGVYGYGSAPTYPTSNYQSSNYWVDIVFATTTGPDVTAPLVQATSPANQATGVSINTLVTATFNEAINVSTVTAANFELRNASNALVPATISASGNIATLTPTSVLAFSSTYTARIKGGSSGVKDVAGNALASDVTWTFTTSDPAAAPPTDGPGGPILVVSTSTNPFSRYAVEILRAEGLNQFAARDITQVTAGDLNNYDVVVLGEMAITAAQASMFTTWVNAGGTLIAFKPSTELSSLLGITKVAGTLADAYLLVNTATGPGAGIVGQTIQFHSAADLYTLNGATSVATLYSNATTATTNPAVTIRTVGANGGRAVAFTYDLARSIVYTRQGNPAWAATERDGQPGPIRSDDLFFGGSQPDYVDFNKIAIPQADEQQRLLTNIIVQANLHRKPLPRFWFLPSGHKAAVVMTGDDHRFNGTTGQFNYFKTQGPNTATDVLDWKAIRGTSYVYNGTLDNAAAAAYQAEGFEVALHVNTNCENFTAASLQQNITTQLAMFAGELPSVALPSTNRIHCIAWSDWATAAKVQAQNGMRLDVNYYYWPGTWVQNRPGMFTGSGMPMRFADLDGTLIDCYQATTQMTDEAGINYTTFSNALLDKAQGPEGYYGVFTTNMHTDSAVHSGANAVIASAIAHQVPVVSAKQMLTWLDGRNNSYFSGFAWTGNQLTFNITALSAARNLRSMLPINSETGALVSLTVDGSSLSYTTQTIKGMQYAFFNVTPGTHTYVAVYSIPNAPPVVTTQPLAKSGCVGTAVSFVAAASGSPVPTVQWQSSPTGTTWTNITGATNATYTFTPVIGDNSKRYRAIFTSSQGTATTNAAILTVNAVPATPTISVSNACGRSVLTASGFTGSLLWSTGATTSSITVYAAGTYTLTQTINGCTSAVRSATASPSGTFTPAPTIAVANNCGTSVLTAGNVVGTLLWSNGATTNSITVNTGGTYSLTQTWLTCTSPVATATAAPKVVPPTPTITASRSTSLCQGESVTLTSSSATGNTWSTGATTQSIVVSTAGSYTVAVSLNGCNSPVSAATAVTVSALPAGTISSSTGTMCADGTAAVVFNATSGTGPFSVVINGQTYTNVTNGGTVNTSISAATSTIWDNTFTPAVVTNDGVPIETGVKFRASANGFIKSIRFYKGSSADGSVYTLNLYQNSTQAVLSSQTFSNTTATGWQVVDLPSPVAVTAGTTYVASCYSAAGNYNYTDAGLTNARVNGPLTALADGTDGVNGLYRYGAGTGMPVESYHSSNYWVDVVYIPSTVTLNLTSIITAAGCTTTGTLGTVTLQVTSCQTFTRVSVAPDVIGSQTGEAAGEKATSSKMHLGQNRPNPFNATTLLDFGVPKKERVRITLYDGSGRIVRVILDETRDAGTYTIPVRRNGLTAGIYYYRLEAGGETLVKKMTIF